MSIERTTLDSARRAMIPLAAAATLAAGLIAGPGAGAGQGAVRTVPIGEFDSPVFAENAPGAPKLVFVVEQGGTIEVVRGGRTLARPFLDISGIVSAGGERGLLSIAFAPNYQRSRRFYVYFTNADGDIEVDEFKRSRRQAVRANPHSRRRVIVIAHRDASNHNGGTVAFGPDGKLWLATGDGGGSGDQFDNASHTSSLLGKLLRIDPRPGKGRPYSTPRDNPYVGKPGRDEIYSYGLRNPYRFSFDGDRIAIGDVGQNAVEEIDFEAVADARGANFGWPQFEGNQPFDPDRPGADPPTPPIHTYPNGPGGTCAVTGGYVVHDQGLPALLGRYVYADFCGGEIRSFVPNVAAGQAEGDAPIGVDVPSLSSFGEGAHGQIYVVSLDGPVFRLEQ